MRIITEDNIEQLESMSFSRNIERLLKVENADIKDMNMKDIIRDIRNLTGEKDINTPERGELGAFKVIQEKEPSYISPAYPSPAYPSPAYPSPDYQSPAYPSPDYPSQPPSPDYPVSSPELGEEKEKEPMIKGGVSEYITGERISIKGEVPNPEDIWIITHTTPEFITVENQRENPQSNDTIRVLDKSEVLPYEEIDFYNSLQESQPHIPYHTPTPYYNHGLPTSISVNPIIKIVNGDDKSSGSLDSGTGTGTGNNTNQPQDTSPMIIQSTNEKVDSHNDSKTIKTDGDIDFTKPLIVSKSN